MAEFSEARRVSLESAQTEAGGAVALLQSSNIGPFVFPMIPPEFTNWRDESRAWKDGVALLEQSYHMTELHLRGPDTIPFLASVCVNKLDPFPTMRAKQLVLAGHDGYMIADAIMFHEAEEFIRVVGAPFASNWLQFNAERGGFNITVKRDENFIARQGKGPRDVFRLQIQGRDAVALMKDVTDGELPDIKFFHIGELGIAGRKVRALCHGMGGGAIGFELFGPWDDQHAVRAALERSGEKFGMRLVGALAYSTTAQESGWMPMPLPAIYHSAQMKPYRQWLDDRCLETIGSLGGSYVSEDIKDYYVDPVEVGYRGLIDFDRDFIGRDALRERASNQRRTKVSLLWNTDDVSSINRDALTSSGVGPKFIALPTSMYSTFQSDAVVKGGELVGISQWSSWSANVKSHMSLALIATQYATPGTELTLRWGEPNPRRRTVEANALREVRVTVAPAPYFAKLAKTAGS